jgi:hypothetical protein
MFEVNSSKAIKKVDSLPLVGEEKFIYRLSTDGKLYSWNTITNAFEGLSSAEFVSKIVHDVKLSQSINKGQAVYVSGATGNNVIVSKASYDTELTSSKTLGLLTNTGFQNSTIKVLVEGLLEGIDTSSATIGDSVWLGLNGNLLYGQANKPSAPNHLVFIGVVTRVQQNNGAIFVKVQNGFELNEIHDVKLTNLQNGDILKRNSTTGLWENAAETQSDFNENNVTSASHIKNRPDLTIYPLKTQISSVGYTGDYNDLLNRPNLNLYPLKTTISSVGYTGDYIDLINKPNLSQYVLASALATVAGSGNYNDLINKPNLSVFALDSLISLVGKTNDYNDLSNKPNLAQYALASLLSTVATTGNFNDLIGKPNMLDYALKNALATVATSGNYNDLVGTPNLSQYVLSSILATIATTGNYDDLINKPNLALYAELDNLANVCFSGDYADLTGAPDLTEWVMDGELAQVAISGNYNDLISLPDLSVYLPLSQRGTNNGVAPLNSAGKVDAQYLSISALNPKGGWDASTNTPTLINAVGTNGDSWFVTASGYVDLVTGLTSSTPLPGYTQFQTGDAAIYFTDVAAYVRVGRDDSVTSVNGLQGNVVLNTDNVSEGANRLYYTAARVAADQIQIDWNSTTGKSRILNRPTLAPVATTNNYADLVNKPNLSLYAILANLANVATSGNYNDLINRPNLGNYALISSLANVAISGDYNALINRPNLNLKANVATTLSGYGITDGVNTSEVVTVAQPSKILRLDANNNLQANSITSTKLETARKIQISGDVSGEANFDGSANININATNPDLIKKTFDGKYPPLDGSQITGIVAQINEVTQDPLGLGNGGMWLLRTDYQEGEILGYSGMTPIIQEDRVDFDLKIKTSKGVRVIQSFN